jgi:hypothetical protein
MQTMSDGAQGSQTARTRVQVLSELLVLGDGGLLLG